MTYDEIAENKRNIQFLMDQMTLESAAGDKSRQ